MSDESIWAKVFKIFIIFALFGSITLNFLQNRTIEHQELAIEHLFKYKKSFIELMGVLKVPPEQADKFLESNSEED